MIQIKIEDSVSNSFLTDTNICRNSEMNVSVSFVKYQKSSILYY